MSAIPQFSMNTYNPSEWSRIEAMQGQDKRRFVVYRGNTTGAGATELFIDGVTNYRLKLYENSVCVCRFAGASLAPSAAGSAAYTGEVAASNINGTVALVAAAVVTKVGNATAALAIAADDTNDSINFTVTPSGAVNTYHEIQVWVTDVTDVNT